MSQFLSIFKYYQNFILFIVLELVCLRIIVKNNHYWEVSFFNTSNLLSGKLIEKQASVKDYFNLKEKNELLAEQNNTLLKKVAFLEQLKGTNNPNYRLDSAFAHRFNYLVAKTINSTLNYTDNYITINKGTEDGVKDGMGVIDAHGLVGRVKVANKKYSLVYSFLHTKFKISGLLKNAQEIGTVSWNGKNPKLVTMYEVSKFKKVSVGDSVMTSEYNNYLPPNVLIGKVVKVNSLPSEAFYQIEIALASNFSNLGFVYVVNNYQAPTVEKLEKDNQ